MNTPLIIAPQTLLVFMDQTIAGDIGWSPGDKIINAIDEDHPHVMSVLSIEIENYDELKKVLTYNQINLLKKRFREFINSYYIKLPRRSDKTNRIWRIIQFLARR